MNIATAKQFHEGDTKSCTLDQITVTSIGETKQGVTAKGAPWKKRDVQVTDSSDQCKITEWGDTVGKLEIGKVYQISGLNRSLYNDYVQFGCGIYTKFSVGQGIVAATEPQQIPKQAGIKPIQLEESVSNIIQSKTELLYAINQKVTEVLKLYNDNPNAQIGQFTGLIWQLLEAKK